jgi:hypothetical protein
MIKLSGTVTNKQNIGAAYFDTFNMLTRTNNSIFDIIKPVKEPARNMRTNGFRASLPFAFIPNTYLLFQKKEFNMLTINAMTLARI